MNSCMRGIIGFLFLINISITWLHARNLELRFEKISIDQGLSHSSVTAIHLDKQGFLWFGTQDGLNRYDGYNFKIFRNNSADSNSLSNDWVTSIAEDKDGMLWIGTAGGGINRFDPYSQKFSNYGFDDEDSENLPKNYVLQTVVDHANTIWYINASGELQKLNRGTDTFTPISMDSISNRITISCIVRGDKNILWLGTTNQGIIRFNTSSNAFRQFTADNYHQLGDNHINYLYYDRLKNLWIATQNGLSKMDPETKTFTLFHTGMANSKGLLDNNIKSIYLDSQNTLWISTSFGLNIKYPNEKHFNVHKHDPGNQQSIGTNVINTIYEDKSGIIWLGTYLDGINKFDRSKNLFTHFSHETDNPNSLTDNNIWGLYEDTEGSIWIGTNKGLNQYIPGKNQFNHYLAGRGRRKLNHNIVRTICQGPSGDIWCGTDGGGINRLNLKTRTFRYYEPQKRNSGSLSDKKVMHIYKDSEKTMWIATWNGLDRYEPVNDNFIHYRHNPDKLTSLCDDRVQCILEDHQGQLWIGTYDGLNMMDKSSGQCTWFRNDPVKPSSISDNRILCIYEDSKNNLWIGTYHGLNKLNGDKVTFTIFTRKNGLVSDVIHGIAEDESGKLWLSTNKGLIQFDPNRDGAFAFKSYDIYDGLSGNEFNTGAYLKSRDGNFYFGCLNGINKFLPSQVKTNKHIPPVVITSFKKFDKNMDLDHAVHMIKTLNLSYKDNFFSFEFAALDFVNPHKNQYAYKLDGFDEEWRRCGTRHYASYTNLDGGKYVFNVRGANNDGVWNTRSTSIEIDISPPFWKTWWFILISIFMVVAAGSLFILYWQRQVTMQQERLKLQVDDRTQDVRASLKKLREAQTVTKNLAAKTRLLYDIGQRIISQLDLDTLLHNIVINAREAFDYYNVMLMFKDKEKNGLVIKSIAGGYEKLYPGDLFVKMGEGLTGKAAQKKKTQLSNNVTDNPSYLKYDGDVTRSELAVPIISKGNVIGVLDIQSNKIDEFTDSDIEIFETFCTQIAGAINNANLFEQLQKELTERKNAQEQLRESWDMLIAAKQETDNIFQNIEEGLFQINSKGEISAQYSKSLETILKQEELGGKILTGLLKDKIPDKIHQSTVEYIELMFDENIDEETLNELNPLHDIEFSSKDAHGNYLDSEFLMFNFKRSYSRDKKVMALIVSVNDVTQQKKLELKLEKSEAEQKNQVEWMFSILHVEPTLLREFMEVSGKELNEIARLLKSTKDPEQYASTVEKIMRINRNLKDSASFLEIKLFERKAMKFEDSLKRMLKLDDIRGTDFISLVIQLEEMRSIIHEIDNLIERLANIHSTFKDKENVNMTDQPMKMAQPEI